MTIVVELGGQKIFILTVLLPPFRSTELLKKREPKFGYRIRPPIFCLVDSEEEGVEISKGTLPIPESLNETLISLEGVALAGYS